MEPAPSHDDDESRPPRVPAQRRSTLSIMLVLAVIVVASTVIALMSGEAPKEPASGQTREEGSGSEVVRGVACPGLREAATLMAVGDRGRSVQAIVRAGREAEDALQRDGVIFGRPERIALELRFLVTGEMVTSDARLTGLISKGVNACPSPVETSSQ